MRFPGRTLRARIVWTTAVVAAVAMAAMVATVVLVLDVTARNSVDATLRDRLGAVSTTLRAGSTGALNELETPDDAIDDTTWIFDPGGDLVDGPRAGKRVRAKVATLADVTKRTAFESHDRVYLAAPVRDRRTGDVTAVVVVTESMGPYETTRIAVLAILVTLGLVVTGGSAAIAAWTMRRALEPVEEMATLAQDWSEHDLESRFDDTRSDDEIAQLGQTLNVLLDRVAGAIRGEQQLTSELAHELRTPLTAIRGEAELGLMASEQPDTAERLGQVIALTDHMNTTISTLLAVARGQRGRRTRSEVAAIIASVLADLRRPSHLHVSADTAEQSIQTAVPAELAERALAPLVANAVRHARSSITVIVTESDRTVDITITDDGPGIIGAASEELFTAGTRDPGSPGAGLGLALSRRVARTLGGDVRVTSTSGPTSFTLTLPRF